MDLLHEHSWVGKLCQWIVPGCELQIPLPHCYLAACIAHAYALSALRYDTREVLVVWLFFWCYTGCLHMICTTGSHENELILGTIE